MRCATRGQDPTLPEMRRVRLLEMADAMDMFCQGTDGEMFDRDGTPWPEADITLVDLATYAREGYNAQLSIAYISLISTVNNIAERDQYPRPPDHQRDRRRPHHHEEPAARALCRENHKNVAQAGRLVLAGDAKHRRSAARRRAHAQHDRVVDLPVDAAGRGGEDRAIPRTLAGAEGADASAARKEAGKFTEGVILSKSMEVLFRAVPPSLYLALAQTEPEEKAERYQLMQQHGVSELDAAFKVAEKIDRARGIESPALALP
jgi:hypothetical protein